MGNIKKRYLITLVLLYSISSLLTADEISFATLPLENPDKIFREMRPFLNYLEKSVNETIKLKYYEDYAEILQKFTEGSIDLVLLGPLPYIHLYEMYPQAVPVVQFLNKDGDSTYTCSLIKGAESGFTTLDQLKGKRIALTQPLSTCGYITVNNFLLEGGFSLADTMYKYLGSHQEVVLSVLRHEFAAGGVKTSIVKMYEHLGIRILGESDPLPGFTLVANSETLDTLQIEKIRLSLLDLKPLQNNFQKNLTSTWGDIVKYGAINTSNKAYNKVRFLIKDVIIPQKGNF